MVHAQQLFTTRTHRTHARRQHAATPICSLAQQQRKQRQQKPRRDHTHNSFFRTLRQTAVLALRSAPPPPPQGRTRRSQTACPRRPARCQRRRRRRLHSSQYPTLNFHTERSTRGGRCRFRRLGALGRALRTHGTDRQAPRRPTPSQRVHRSTCDVNQPLHIRSHKHVLVNVFPSVRPLPHEEGRPRSSVLYK